MALKKKKEEKININDLVDKELIAEIQSQGGLSFRNEKFIKTGDGYECCVHIYGFPKYIDTFWLNPICNTENAIVTIDIATEDINEVKRNINRSMQEQDTRYSTAKKVTDKKDAENRYQELDEMYNDISVLGEIVKLVHIRVFVAGKTLTEVDEETKRIINRLESLGYKSAVFLNETKAEWSSMYKSYTEQQNTEFKRYGQPLLSEMLASGNPFYFTKLNDKYGTYLGHTSSTYGSVLFDMFAKDNRRMSYNGLCVGRMGAGKSTLLKKLMTDMSARGNYIRGFDVTGEWRDLVEAYGGKIISLDGSQGILNALEVLKTGENDIISFNRHLSKLTTIYKFLVKDVDTYEIIEFEQLLKDFYQDFGLLSDDENKQLTGLSATAYPIWSDFLNYIKKLQNSVGTKKGTVQTELEIDKQKRINNIRLVIQNLVESYGHIFNGHTSIDNILDTQIVFFDIKNLANMKSEIFDAQMFTALLLCWDNCLKIGNQMKDLYDKNKIAWEDITRFMIFIDEAHRIINTNKLQAVEQLIVFEREARKFFGGLLYASQSIRDFVPEGSNQDSVDKIKTLFELTQYKFIMQQDSNCLDLLNNVFQHQLTESELLQIPSLEKGECILSISSDKNIQFYVDCTDAELELFRGGA